MDLATCRTRLIATRSAEGADTPNGIAISGIIEQLEKLPNYVRQDWARDERQTLPYLLEKKLARLESCPADLREDILQVAHAALLGL
jgi:hypothetical protein